MADTGRQIRAYDGAVAIVTGGASGIGRALGEELAGRGCEVVLADVNQTGAAGVARTICARGGSARAAALNVTDAGAVDALVEETFQRCGRLDYLFNNAGIALNGKFEDFELSHWQRTVDINLMGVVHGSRAAQRVMAAQGFGHIVNTASFAGIFPWPTTIAYTTCKHAVVGMSTAMRAELAHLGIRVSVLCPGPILTPMIENGASPERWVGTYPTDKLEAFFGTARGMPADTFARKVLDRVAKNPSLIVLPTVYRVLWWINRVSPNLAIGLAGKIYDGIMKQVSD